MICNGVGQTKALARRLAQCIAPGDCVYLHGDLGAGKTTFARALIQALGFSGTVKSPTYTIVESYPCAQMTVFHFDFYRLKDPEELELMGVRDYFDNDSVQLIEWPEQAKDYISDADYHIYFSGNNACRSIEIVYKDSNIEV